MPDPCEPLSTGHVRNRVAPLKPGSSHLMLNKLVMFIAGKLQ